jgi:hypothetical protein
VTASPALRSGSTPDARTLEQVPSFVVIIELSNPACKPGREYQGPQGNLRIHRGRRNTANN